MLAVWAALGADPDLRGSRPVPRVRGVRAYPLRLARRLAAAPGERVGRPPRHIVLHRVAEDGEVEILGMAHDRMLLSREARRLVR